jgi:hypothetical protein
MAQQKIVGRSSFKVVTAGVPPNQDAIIAAPDLVIRDETFHDADSNNIIDGNENSSISLKVENLGKGDAKDVKLKVSLKNDQISGLEFPGLKYLGLIKAGEVKEVIIPLKGTFQLTDGLAEFKMEVLEEKGFDAVPLEMKIETHPFQPPNVCVVDAVFSTEKGGQIKLNIPIQLKVLVQNTGKGVAKNIGLICQLPNENCLPLGLTDKFHVEKLMPGESKEFDYSFIANRRYSNAIIPINLRLTESYGKYSHDTVVNIAIDQTVAAKSNVVVAALPSSELVIEKASLTSEVDKNIPVSQRKDSLKFALLIGNEDYSRYQTGLNSEADVQFARNDAGILKEYLIKTLGFPENNVYLLLDATTGEMNQKIDLICKRAIKAGKEAELVFYYAGHGLPEESTRIPYLIPVDINSSNISQGIKLGDVLWRLGETGVKKVWIILDACFTGGARGTGLLATRSVKVKPSEDLLTGNTIVFSASSGDQSAMPYQKERHGLFTYFLLKKIQQTEGNISFGELSDYLQKMVSITSLEVNQKEQDPTVVYSQTIKEIWNKWKLNDIK